ncbi:uncharacterized protein TRIADDRAFT_61769 [Trichoplax adhaerens]|uniref:Uncharacterized protein n=1 Tax=Trichoplax adhaerens TaxID=10228 RepID=B3SBX4_TRIAD|nr:hypothetical protein TRIADDRAFT_61769 [Trichoplax adhaerens]EDV19750.1 hypothetical protein TRIADDRAFT_61769 [Trichoplax adhaerens]|eukprot:XP_002117774.1 hypothetical protein TRIADDRAFT_61769 [Trichoplax adhaerens]
MWWDAFAADFFEDDATLTIIKLSPNDDSRNRLTIGRTLIPRFFRSMFDRGVTDLYFILNQPRDSVARSIITMECDDAAMVYTEGKLTLDLTCDDSMRIRRWMFAIKNHKEYMQVNANENRSYGVNTTNLIASCLLRLTSSVHLYEKPC